MGKHYNPESFIVRSWYQKSLYLYFLFPLSILYFLISQLRRAAYRLGLFSSYKASVPIVVVGNINVGGTGKTPLAIALVKALQKAGFTPGIISRGYGSKAPAYPFIVLPDDSPDRTGDEPLLLAIRTGVPVVIDANRKQAINELLNNFSCDVIISDDGLQHYALQRDIEIVIVDSRRQFGNKLLLPAGPLRETVTRLKSVDYVVSNGGMVELAFPVAQYAMTLEALNFISLNGESVIDANHWQGSKLVHAVAGIGNPQRFYNSLRQLGLTPLEHSFPDHHVFKSQDLDFADDLPIIMTEKDAVKARYVKPHKNCWYLSVSANVDEEFFDRVVDQLKT